MFSQDRSSSDSESNSQFKPSSGGLSRYSDSPEESLCCEQHSLFTSWSKAPNILRPLFKVVQRNIRQRPHCWSKWYYRSTERVLLYNTHKILVFFKFSSIADLLMLQKIGKRVYPYTTSVLQITLMCGISVTLPPQTSLFKK